MTQAVRQAVEGAAERAREEGQQLAEQITPDEIRQLSSLQKIIHYFKKKEWSSMVGAMMVLLKEFLGGDDEDEKAEKSKTEAEKEARQEAAKARAQEGLADLREGVDEAAKKVRGAAEAGDEEEAEPPEEEAESADLGDASDEVFIGDSIVKGMQSLFGEGKKPEFIGKEGNASSKTLEELREKKDKLNGKKRALIYTGGNNFGYVAPDRIVQDMIGMAQLCQKAGIPEILVCTRFPNDPRRKVKLTDRAMALREELLKAYRENRFPQGVKIVDLYKHFANEHGELKPEHMLQGTRDFIHPWGAYREALSLRQKESDESPVS